MEAFKIIRLKLSKLQVELLSMVPVQAKTPESSGMRHSHPGRACRRYLLDGTPGARLAAHEAHVLDHAHAFYFSGHDGHRARHEEGQLRGDADAHVGINVQRRRGWFDQPGDAQRVRQAS